ncbi:MAG: acylphosphatase [Tatlockia sp.]|nr:acylphosphatase [Tatlockia sp.]
MAKQLCMRCYISGRVQGVWFRASAKKEADHLAITGWARNLPDGRVEILACGEEKHLNLFSSWLHQGPQFAEVSAYTREDLAWQEFEGFKVL